jgi:hypothetical protein
MEHEKILFWPQRSQLYALYSTQNGSALLKEKCASQ